MWHLPHRGQVLWGHWTAEPAERRAGTAQRSLPHPSRSSVTLHAILLGVGGTIYNKHTLEPLKELGLDSQRVKKLASKLHVYSVNFAAKLVYTRRAISSTVTIDSHQETVSGQACKPPDPHGYLIFPLVEEVYGTWYQGYSFSLINMGNVFHCLRSFFTNTALDIESYHRNFCDKM